MIMIKVSNKFLKFEYDKNSFPWMWNILLGVFFSYKGSNKTILPNTFEKILKKNCVAFQKIFHASLW